MCGIWAFLQQQQKQQNQSSQGPTLFHDFLQLAPRGPDHLSYEHIASAGLTLGFHRLAIVNPTLKGNQPFKWEDPTTGKTLILMCNGEIYNYKELVALNGFGPLNSDCEVLLHLYRYHSFHGFVHAIEHDVKGEFAFLLFELDALKRVAQVVAGRDAVGVRPLYVSNPNPTPTPLLFTSELKGALHYEGDMMEFPPGAIWRYTVDALGQLHKRGPEKYTFVDSLYSPPSSPKGSSESDHLAHLRTAILASVQRRLEADRPLAFLLSGGIDSSLVAGLSARLLGKPIRTFCCSIKDKNNIPLGRDVEYAREVAQHLGSEHTEVLFTKEEALAAIPDVIRTVESWDTTTIRASVGQYMVCRWIGQNTDCKVVLVGEGPDEVCSSYLFNWYAPSAEALDQSARDYVRNIHLYDARRADRCIARWGLEARVPFLDPEFIQAYWSIPAKERMPATKGIEKWWLREAFKDDEVVPERVRLRMKDAFSDSISGQVSWTQMIQEWVETQVSDAEFQEAPRLFPSPPGVIPQTKEAFYYRRLFCEIFGPARQTILPGYWQPRWNKDGQEVKEYVDPSARTLSVYSDLTGSSNQ